MIYLIRHGETEANIKHIYCGSTDLPLSEAGVEKLRGRRDVPAVAELRLRAADADVVSRDDGLVIGDAGFRNLTFITSGMKRTEQTLELLFGEAIFEPGGRVTGIFGSSVDHSVDMRFREIDFGIFEMRSYHDLKDTPEYQEWISGDNETNVCPGGESGRQMEARVMEAFNELQEQFLKSVDSNFAADNFSVTSCTDVPDRDIVVVTHGGVIAAIMNNLFPEEDKTRFDWQPAPGCGYVIVNASEYKEL